MKGRKVTVRRLNRSDPFTTSYRPSRGLRTSLRGIFFGLMILSNCESSPSSPARTI